MQNDDLWNRLCNEMTAAFGTRRTETVKSVTKAVSNMLVIDRAFPAKSASGTLTSSAEIVIKDKFGKLLAKKRLPLQEDAKLDSWAIRWLEKHIQH